MTAFFADAAFFVGVALAVAFAAGRFAGALVAAGLAAAFFVVAALLVPAVDFFTAVNSTSLRVLPAPPPSAPGHCGTAVPPTSTSGRPYRARLGRAIRAHGRMSLAP